jgi:hypothetical protein
MWVILLSPLLAVTAMIMPSLTTCCYVCSRVYCNHPLRTMVLVRNPLIIKEHGWCALHKQLSNAPYNSAACPCCLSPGCSLHPPCAWCLCQRRQPATVHRGFSMPSPLALPPLLPLSPTTPRLSIELFNVQVEGPWSSA